MKSHKTLKLMALIIATGTVLAGCGAHHSKSMNYAAHTASEEVSHKPKTRRKPAKKSHTNVHEGTSSSKVAPAQQANRQIDDSSSSNRTSVQASQQATQNDNQSNQSNGLPTVNLGHGVTGVEDRGAGQVYVSFTVNGQHFVSHGNDVNEPANSALNNAKGIVNNLSNN